MDSRQKLPALSIKSVVSSIEGILIASRQAGFRKSKNYLGDSERAWLERFKFYFAGRYFQSVVEPERTIHRLPVKYFPETRGRIDFVIDGIAIEIAVRNQSDSKSKLLPKHNSTEILKLLRHTGPSLLVLIDFSDSRITDLELKQYRTLPSPGKGNFKFSSFNVAYFSFADAGPVVSQLRILK